MPFFHHKMRRLRDSSMTMLAIAFIMLALMLILAVAVEWGRLIQARSEMQQWCDAAALAGAAELPNAKSATQVAAGYYARNLGMELWQCLIIDEQDGKAVYDIGGDEVTITTPYQDNEVQRSGVTPEYAISVSAEREVPMMMGRLLRINSINVSANSVAIYEPSSLKWVLFNNSSNEPLTITGSEIHIEGSLHTNSDLVVRGSRHDATGVASVVGFAQITGSGHSFNVRRTSQRQPPPLPTALEFYRKQAEQSGQLIVGEDYKLSASDMPSGIVFVEGGDIISHGHGFNANVTLIAVRKGGRGGRIRIVSNSWQLSPSDGILLMYADEEVEIHGSNIAFNGIIYAPNGYVRITGSGIASTGIIGNGIRIDGHGMNLNPSFDIFKERQARLLE